MMKKGWGYVCAGMLACMSIGPAVAQTATVDGFLGAFDVVNDSGQDAHGFEIRIEGAVLGDLYYSMNGQRYGMPKVSAYATGVSVRYESPYDASNHAYTATTPQHAPGTPFSWNDCYAAGARYTVSGCEHFGQSLRPTQQGQITGVTGYWLVDDPANPGTLIRLNPPAAIPFVLWSVPSFTSTLPTAPVVVAEVEAPEPPESPELYGDAQWVKIYKTELPRFVSADELSSINPSVVPEDASQVEVAWDILQVSPPSGGNAKRNRSRKQNQGGIAPTTLSVIRRYELYKYTGAYDATTHQVVCADGTCTAPSAGELGDALSSNNTATNLTPDVVLLTRDGGGTVTSTNGINCGNTCAAFATHGTTVTLTANPGGLAFTGWTGACSGTQATCTVPVIGQVAMGTGFKAMYTLSVGRSNSGTVIGTPNGTDRQLNCGGACSAKFVQGTAVTLTAIPPAGKTFVNWSGACSGADPTCTVTINGDTKVQAVFSK